MSGMCQLFRILIGKVLRSPWLSSHYVDFSTVCLPKIIAAKSAIVNSNENLGCASSTQENNLQITANISSNRFYFRQELNMQETCAKEKLGKIGAWLETFPRKSLMWIAQQVGVFASLCQNRCIRQVWFTHCDTYYEEELNFVNWYHHRVRAVEVHPMLILFTNEVWCHLSGFVQEVPC